MNKSSSGMERPRLAIVGAGFLGSDLAKALERDMDVTLIERASHFTHTPAMIRAMIEPDLLDRALIPYEGLLARGQVVRAEAIAVDGDGVTLANGERIAADYIVVAAGSANFAPFKNASGNIETLRSDNDRWHKALGSARSVLIVGAGAVGTELAGEIAHAHPDKIVTLVSRHSSLFPGFPPGLGRSLYTKLRKMGVQIIVGESAESFVGQHKPEGGSVLLSSGLETEADLVIPAVGSRAVAKLAVTLPGVEFDESGRVMVDRWMRPSRLPNVFAAGDMAAIGDLMTIVAISSQKPWLVKTLKALGTGRNIDTLKPYAPWGRAPIILPLGSERGSSSLMVLTVGNRITRMIKGKDLFLTKYNKLLGRD